MAEKLVVEFYDGDARSPMAAVLVRHLGEDPVAAAIALAGFMTSLDAVRKSSHVDAGDLVSRFILWEADLAGCTASCPNIGTSFIAPAPGYGYQVVRLRTIHGAVHVEIATDEYTTDEELDRASSILSLARLPSSFSAAEAR